MSGSVFFALLFTVIFIVLGIAMSPVFIIPAVIVVLFLLMSGPLLAAMGRTAGRREASGTPTTSEAAYEPVSEPQERGAV